MNTLTLFLGATLLLSQAGQAPPRKQLEIRIEKFQPTSFGFDVWVTVRNIGTQVVVLAEGGGKPGMLQSLDIQQWDRKLGWQSVGPCRDVPPLSTVKLHPGEELHNVIPIGDLGRL